MQFNAAISFIGSKSYRTYIQNKCLQTKATLIQLLKIGFVNFFKESVSVVPVEKKTFYFYSCDRTSYLH